MDITVTAIAWGWRIRPVPEQRLSRVSNPLLSYEYPVLTPHAPWLGSVQNPSQLSFLYHYHTRSHAGLLCVVVITLLTGIRHNEHPSTAAHPVVFLVNVRMVSPGCAVMRAIRYASIRSTLMLSIDLRIRRMYMTTMLPMSESVGYWLLLWRSTCRQL